MSERTQVTNKIMKWIKVTKNVYGYKVYGNSIQGAGLPDIIMCYKGRFMGVECKKENEKATKIQLHEISKINKAGGIGVVVDTYDKFLDIIKAIDEIDG